ncbi:MAG: thiamine pyrophosphate-dependent enzyme [Saprospiraceae bacterium]
MSPVLKEQREFFTYFNWQQFTEEEWLLCPPVVALGGDGAMYDIGFQNLSRMMASGKPIKVIVVDTQVCPWRTGLYICRRTGRYGPIR